MHLAEAGTGHAASGCGCATMSRNDPPHLAGILDLLRKDEAPDICRVLAGDSVDERTGRRESGMRESVLRERALLEADLSACIPFTCRFQYVVCSLFF